MAILCWQHLMSSTTEWRRGRLCEDEVRKKGDKIIEMPRRVITLARKRRLDAKHRQMKSSRLHADDWEMDTVKPLIAGRRPHWGLWCVASWEATSSRLARGEDPLEELRCGTCLPRGLCWSCIASWGGSCTGESGDWHRLKP